MQNDFRGNFNLDQGPSCQSKLKFQKSVVRVLSHNSCLIFSKPFASLTKSVLTVQNGNYYSLPLHNLR